MCWDNLTSGALRGTPVKEHVSFTEPKQPAGINTRCSAITNVIKYHLQQALMNRSIRSKSHVMFPWREGFFLLYMHQINVYYCTVSTFFLSCHFVQLRQQQGEQSYRRCEKQMWKNFIQTRWEYDNYDNLLDLIPFPLHWWHLPLTVPSAVAAVEGKNVQKPLNVISFPFQFQSVAAIMWLWIFHFHFLLEYFGSWAFFVRSITASGCNLRQILPQQTSQCCISATKLLETWMFFVILLIRFNSLFTTYMYFCIHFFYFLIHF